jgi:hypothetical protein
MQIPANLPEPTQQGSFITTEGTADQIDPGLANAKSIVVGINVYESPAGEFARRANVLDWANHPMPPTSAYRRDPIEPARIEQVIVPGAAAAAMSISLHDGYEPFGTGGQRALSLRLFVKPASGEDGWVVGAHATGDAASSELSLRGTLAQHLEQILRSFTLASPARGRREPPRPATGAP